MKAASGPPVFTEQVLLLRVVTAETFFVQQYHVATIREKKTVGLPKIQPTASHYDDMVRKRRHRHTNDRQTNFNILGRKASLGGSTDTNSENQRAQDLPVIPDGPLPVCSLDGATFIDPELVQAKIGNLDDRARTERHTH